MLVTEQNYNEIVDSLSKQDSWTVDVETNGLDPYSVNQICGVGVITEDEKSYYFPFRHQQGHNLSPEILKSFISVMSLRKEYSKFVNYYRIVQ